MHQTFVAAIIVATMGLSCHSAAPVQDAKQDSWMPTGAGKIVARTGVASDQLDKRWIFYSEISDGESPHMVRVANPMTLTDAITLHERLVSNRILKFSPIFDGKIIKDTQITGWEWTR